MARSELDQTRPRVRLRIGDRPFGGLAHSGFGTQGAPAGLHEFHRITTVGIA